MDALLIDLDWTLIDLQGHTDYEAALEDTKKLINDWPDVNTPDTGWDAPARLCMEVLVALSGDPRWEEVSETIERHEIEALSRSTAMPGLANLIQAVDSRPVAVVTLVGPRATLAVLAAHGVPFTTVVPRGAGLRPKPAPDQLLEACRLLGVEPSQATMVGDSTWDLKAARSAGIRFIGVTNHRPSEFPEWVETLPDLVELSARLRA